MAALLYIMGGMFAIAGMLTGATVAWAAAAFYLTMEPMRLILESLGLKFGAFAYFSIVAAIFGTYLFSHESRLLMVSGIACYATAVIIMLSSKQAFLGDYFYRNWDIWSALTNSLIIFPLALYLGGLMKL